MPLLPRLLNGLRTLAGRGPVQRDLDAEISGYFELLVDEKVASGSSPVEARRLARLEMDGVEQVKEAVRAGRPAAWLDTVARDLRHSVRVLARTPAFSLTAVVVLALGIGVNAAVFTVVNVLSLRPLPGAEQPGEVVGVYARDAAAPDSYRPFSYAEYEAVRDQAGLFEHLMAHRSIYVGLSDGDAARRTKAAFATGSYFDTLGVGLAAGRTFTPDEERPGSRAAVAVLSHPYWERLGRPRDILGRTILVNARPFTVIGIGPPGFVGPMVLAGPEFWMPLGAATALDRGAGGSAPTHRREARNLMVTGRLKPGITAAAANAALRGLSDRLADDRSPTDTGLVLTVSRLARGNQGNSPQDDGELVAPLGALVGAALVVLLVASLNVANMQLARGTNRRKEIAMRLALGASRGRIVGQLLTEGLVLALAGGALGLAAAVWTLKGVVASLAAMVPQAFWADVTPDWRVALVSFAFCALSALAFSLGPAWQLSRLDLLPEMKSQDGAGSGAGLRRFGTRNLLVAGQIALSLALLAASGLFVRGAVAAAQADPGYRFDRQFLVRLDAAGGGHDESSGREAYRRVMDRIRSMPDVESAALASLVAFGNDSFTRRAVVAGATSPGDPAGTAGVTVQSYAVGATYFETLGLAMLRGREFTPAEEVGPSSSDAVIIDEPLASALFPGQDPLGQLIAFASGTPGGFTSPVRIVGVAPGLRHRLTDAGPVPHVYLPLASHYRPLLNIHVRVAPGGGSDAPDFARALRNAVRATDAGLAVLAVQTLEQARDAMPVNWIVRAAGSTFGAFGAMTLFMAAIGLYGVKAYLVARRTREIGIRLALGAREGDVIRMVLKEGAVLLVVAIAVGFVLAVGVGQAVGSLLVGVRPFDPLVLSVATLVLGTAVLTACILPARRATRIPPVIALRVE